jgi:phospholipase/lecithinase/hemolysin
MELSFMASPSNPHPRNVTAALASATRSAQSLINQLSWLIPPTSQKGAIAPDFLVLPIVPLEEVSRAQYLARKGDMDISVVKQLVQTYNSVLMDGLDYLAKTLGDRGNVFTYDIPS